MPRSNKKRSASVALEPVTSDPFTVRVAPKTLGPFRADELALLCLETDDLPRVDDDGDPLAIVLADRVQDATAARLLKGLKLYEKGLKIHPAYVALRAAVDAAESPSDTAIDSPLSAQPQMFRLESRCITM